MLTDSLLETDVGAFKPRTYVTAGLCDNGKLFAAYEKKLFYDVVLIAGDKR